MRCLVSVVSTGLAVYAMYVVLSDLALFMPLWLSVRLVTVLLPQPPRVLGLQACVNIPGFCLFVVVCLFFM